MSSSPQRSPRSSPRNTPRTTPKRTPLQERTQSEANERSSRVRREKQPVENRNIYAISPFPSKPQQIFLPSTLKKQKSSQNLAGDVFGPTHGVPSRTSPREVLAGGKRPAVELKRSVKTLRDLYEAQADESRPSTALTNSRPNTSSSKVRSFSSNDGLSGRYAWDQLQTVSSDDLALLPSLPEGQTTLKRLGSQSSFASRAARHGVTSSPNFRVIDATSSPRIPVFKDLSEISSEPSEDLATEAMSSDGGQSSPNLVQLGRTSSLEDLPSLNPPSPRTKFEASPARTIIPIAPSSPTRPASSSSSASRKRKRSEADEGRSFAARIGAANAFPSSPPVLPTNSSSPPPSDSLPSGSIDESSPVFRVLQNDSSSIDQSSVVRTHTNLQDAISSSPAPPIQYPVVRAPADTQSAGIVVPKRKYRSSQTTETLSPRWPSRLTAPSQESFSQSKDGNPRTSWAEEEEIDDFDLDSMVAVQAYMLSSSANNSQVRMVLDSDRHEGEDEISALPGDGHGYRSPPVPNKSTSYLSSNGSSQSRLASLDLRLERMRSYSLSRQNSMRSFRPGSSGSAVSTTIVPTWARKYYSGFYHDSFHFLAASSSNINVSQIQHPLPPLPHGRPDSLTTTARSSRQSLQSLRDSLRDRVPSIFRPKNRLTLGARKSHSMPGVGPLCSNPLREPATSAMMSGARQARHDNRATIRPVSFPLSLQDPRAHWNGMTEGFEHIPEDQTTQPSPIYHRPASANPSSAHSVIYYPPRNRWGRRPSHSPHLHHDHRLNTGSTASRGFGHPFNRKSYMSAPSLRDEPGTSNIKTSRNTQVTLFLIGFCLPFTWFVAALLPLPHRPDTYHDLEKSHWEHHHDQGHGGHGHEYEQYDVLSRLKREKQLRGSEEILWQSVRWWRMLNRWMCVVGALVIVMVIVLAAIGTRGW